MKIIIVAGIYRSGSTWLYNAIRLSLKCAKKKVYGCYVGDWNKKHKAEYHVVKLVRYDEELPHLPELEAIFTSYRNLDSIIGSMKRRAENLTDDRFINETKHENISDYILNLLKWQQWSDYMMLYERAMRQPAQTIHQICAVLNIEPDVNLVCEKLNALKVPKTGFNKTTLLHAGHITSS